MPPPTEPPIADLCFLLSLCLLVGAYTVFTQMPSLQGLAFVLGYAGVAEGVLGMAMIHHRDQVLRARRSGT